MTFNVAGAASLSSLLMSVAIFALSSQSHAAAVIDDAGHEVVLDAPAQRIVSLAPSLTELVYAIGAGNKLVGAIEYSDYPEAALELPRVGRHDLVDMETILALQPDLVLAWLTGNPRATVERLRELGLTVYIAEPKRLDSIPSHMRRIGELVGSGDRAEAAITDFSDTLADLESRYSGLAPVRTFYQIWNGPLITAGGNELINDIITLCGGENVFADLQLMAPKVSSEAVLVELPEAIIASGADDGRPAWLDDWYNWPVLPAVAQGNLFHIPPALVQRHTPRALQGAQMMCEQLDQARNSLD